MKVRKKGAAAIFSVDLQQWAPFFNLASLFLIRKLLWQQNKSVYLSRRRDDSLRGERRTNSSLSYASN